MYLLDSHWIIYDIFICKSNIQLLFFGNIIRYNFKIGFKFVKHFFKSVFKGMELYLDMPCIVINERE